MSDSISLSITIILVVVLIHPLFAEAMPPLKQLKSGIIESNVKCADNLYLTLSPLKHRIACVTIETAQKLGQRGWQLFIPQSPEEASLVLKECNDPAPLVDNTESNNDTNSQYNHAGDSYEKTFWWAPSNSVVKICMKYISTYDNIKIQPVILEYGSYNDTKLQVKSSQDVISKGSTIVSYEFYTGNQKGQYWFGFVCGGFPIVIGSDASKLNRTDYPLDRKYSCPAWTYDNSTVIGTSGIYEKHFKN